MNIEITRNKIIAAGVYTLVLVAGGYWLAPMAVKTRTQTVIKEVMVEVEVKKEVKDVRTKTQVTETTKPDGTKTTVSVTDQVDASQTSTDTAQAVNISTTATESKEVTKSGRIIQVSALAGRNFFSGPPLMVYGAHATAQIIGPITAGIFGLSNGLTGVSVGISF